jgi:hypothetical protein
MVQNFNTGAILFFPIGWGKYEIVKILLENGASATFWPKDAKHLVGPRGTASVAPKEREQGT